MANIEDTGNSLPNRVWRLEQQTRDALSRLDRFEQKLENHEKVQEHNVWRITNVEDQIKVLSTRTGELESHTRPKAPQNGMIAGFSENVIKFVVYGLLAAVVALASGQFATFVGIFK